MDHARFNNVLSHVKDLMARLFDSEKPQFSAWVWFYDVDHHWLDPMPRIHPIQPSATPLYYASLCGLQGLVEQCIVARPQDINALGGFYDTPLHAASAKGHFAVVELLLNNNANPSLCGDNPNPPIHSASRSGHLEVAKILLDHGVCVDEQASGDSRGWTPLHIASGYGRLEIVNFLIQCGATVDQRNGTLETPLFTAASNGMLEIVQLLLNSGANPNVKYRDHWTPLHAAAKHGYHGIVKLLLGSGVRLDEGTNIQDTALHLACFYGRLEV
jgi:ankyrin repeat protein